MSMSQYNYNQSQYSHTPTLQYDENLRNDPEWREILRKLKENMFKDIQQANFEVLQYDPQKELGLVQYIRTEFTNNLYIARFIHMANWYRKNIYIDDLIKYMISIPECFQEFLGYYIDDQEGKVCSIFEKPNISVEQYFLQNPKLEKEINNVFFSILEALCYLECLGLHHPDINGRSTFKGLRKNSGFRVSNPFLYDSFMDSFTHVYLNPINTVHGKKNYNKRKLQENVFCMCLLVLSLITETPFNTFEIKHLKDYDYQKIQTCIARIPQTYSRNLVHLLENILTNNIDVTPTPLELSLAMSFTPVGNSYYNHSPPTFKDYTPFKKQKSRVIFGGYDLPLPPAQQYNSVGNTSHQEIEKSKYIGSQFRRKKNFVMDCDYYDHTLRPYTGIIPTQPEEESIIQEEPVLVQYKAPPPPVYQPAPPRREWVDFVEEPQSAPEELPFFEDEFFYRA